MTIHHGHDSTIIERDSSPAAALWVVAALVLVGFLVWLFAFSNVVIHRGPANSPGNTTIENNNNGGTGGGTGGGGSSGGATPQTT